MCFICKRARDQRSFIFQTDYSCKGHRVTGLSNTAIKRLVRVRDQFSPAERQIPAQNFKGQLKKTTAVLQNRRKNIERSWKSSNRLKIVVSWYNILHSKNIFILSSWKGRKLTIGWQNSNYNRSSMVYRWISPSQWSEILGHGKFQTRFWNNRTKCYSFITNMLQKMWMRASWKLHGPAHLASSLLLSRFLNTDSYLFLSRNE